MNAFKERREQAKFKQVEVAEILGVLQPAISMWETGPPNLAPNCYPK